ncbi:MAG TPA: hypothetical protein VHD91_08485 [Gaiellaceae bacterium]|jgi:hypothetical protein|nr:hypothetical protein [Gaiellaceae bacterium]
MKVIYQGPHREVEVAHDGGGTTVARRGDAVEVPDEVGASLLSQGEGGEQTWRKASPKEAAKATAKQDDEGEKGGEQA